MLLLVSLEQQLHGQEIPITNTTINACGGFLLDSQGNGGPYTANEDIEMTICPEAPETVLNLFWTLMQLGAGDYIELYDGPSSLFPLLGTYTGNQLLGDDITSNNGTGCITIHFVSDGNTQGNFGAEISCGTPCVRPIPQITSNEGNDPVYLCPGESITLNGNASIIANSGTVQSFEWEFDDGTTDNTSWPQVTHTYSEPGGYKVNLHITDDNDCSSSLLTEFIVLVSTEPVFDLITEVDQLCAGGNVTLGVTQIPQDSTYVLDSLNLWITEPWVDLPDANLDGDYCIPDNQSECFPSELTFTQFSNTETIDEVSDIESLFVNIEHSFIGDLTITFICPNGQALAVHQQGGGGTNFGIPEPTTSDECPIPLGEGWDYYWSPSATNGTMEAEAVFGAEALPSASYQSVAPWTDLIGCPLNGTWTLLICDMFGFDDGNIFTWNIHFSPEHYNNLLQFTPHYGPDCDSTFWAGPAIATYSTGCDWVEIELESAGSYDYTYTAINNFGCTFDTTITITVTESPTVNAGLDFSLDCNLPSQQLAGWFNNIPPPSFTNDGGTFNYTYQNDENLVWTFCPDPGSEDYTSMQFEFQSGEMEAFFESFIMYDGPDINSPILIEWEDGDASGQIYTANNPSGCLTFAFDSDFIISAIDGDFNPWTYVISGVANVPEFVWEWSPAGGLSDPNIPDPVVSGLNESTTYTLTGYPVGQPGCGSTDEVNISVFSSFTTTVEENYSGCYGDTIALAAPQIIGGNAPFEINWQREDGTLIADDAPLVPIIGLDEYCAIVEDNCAARDTSCTLVTPYPTIEAAFSADSTFGCAPFPATLTTATTDFELVDEMIWHFDDASTTSSMGTVTHDYEAAGQYWPWLEIIDLNGCSTKDTLPSPLIVWPKPYANFAADPLVAVLPNTVVNFNNYSSNADSYLWHFDAFGQSSAEDTTYRFPLERADTYFVELIASNQYGCIDSTTRQVIVQEDIDIYIPNSFTPDYDGINDVWEIQGRGYQGLGFELLIFNRWGDVIFESTDPFLAWTGDVNGGEMFAPDGMYFYRLKIRDVAFDINHLYEGHIYLIR